MIKSSAIKILNSFDLKVCAKQLIVIDHIDDIKKLNNQDCKNFFIIGEATNLIMNEYYDGSIIKVAIEVFSSLKNLRSRRIEKKELIITEISLRK